MVTITFLDVYDENIIELRNQQTWKQAGAEMGQAQLKLELDFT